MAIAAAAATAPAEIKIETGFANFNWYDPGVWEPEHFQHIDVLTLSYTLSEVWRYNDDGSVEANIDRIISALRPGALVLYSDNSGEHFDPHAEAFLFSRADLIDVDRHQHDHMLIGGDEQKDVLQEYRTWMGGSLVTHPKLTGKATSAAFLKRAI